MILGDGESLFGHFGAEPTRVMAAEVETALSGATAESDQRLRATGVAAIGYGKAGHLVTSLAGTHSAMPSLNMTQRTRTPR